MDVEKQHEKLGCPLFITLALLTMIPLSTGYIDCRISCRRCHENTEHPSVLEVYCAMCEECKQRRRERMANRTPSRRMTPTTAAQLVRMRDGVSNSAEARGHVQISGSKASTAQSITEQDLTQTSKPVQSPPVLHVHQHPKLAQRNAYYGQMDSGYPAGCPTPPMCESEEQILVYPSPPPSMPSMPAYTTTTTTTTTTQPTQPPCPPVHTCRKKKPSMHGMSCMPCMPMCPCPMYPYPPQQQQLQQLQQPQQPQQPQAVLNQPTTAASSQAGQDYHYLYVGLPKNVFNTN